MLHLAVQPGQFWGMTVTEWFWLVRAKTDMIEAQKKAIENPNAPSDVDWQELRAEFDRKVRRRNG